MNTFGRIFRLTTWGESHGAGIGCVVDGCPSGLELSVEDIQQELNRRRPGQSSVTTGRREEDRIEILSGLFNGKTIGTPISMLIKNRNADSSRYESIRNIPRPGHADLTWRIKFGYVDYRGGGRASGRETASRVAAGAVAKKLLRTKGIEIIAYTKEISGIITNNKIENIEKIRKTIDSNTVRTIDKKKAEAMERVILEAKSEKDSVGGVIEAIAFNVPAGLGEPIFGKLDADLAGAMLSIPSVKGIEIGDGFKLTRMMGSEANDEFLIKDDKIITKTNHCGGILGGISNGMPIVVRVAIKPTSSIGKKQNTVNIREMKETSIEVEGRHDPCIIARAVPVVEAMMSLVLADHMLISGMIPRKFQNMTEHLPYYIQINSYPR